MLSSVFSSITSAVKQHGLCNFCPIGIHLLAAGWWMRTRVIGQNIGGVYQKKRSLLSPISMTLNLFKLQGTHKTETIAMITKLSTGPMTMKASWDQKHKSSWQMTCSQPINALAASRRVGSTKSSGTRLPLMLLSSLRMAGLEFSPVGSDKAATRIPSR